ncbi:Nuclear distribution protein nudE 1 [Hypsizygus marmoreus]|uniref:Nuclear distribution protein nudE 1 n=1 Tax=Hypsizygus marmoreus TaxID=39966 RepID=A0A369K730_HYPMA|nr:Nuclear distribution protein nudE 1 [Hypsizygus marmoreus]
MSSDLLLPGQPIPLPRGPVPQIGAGTYLRDAQVRASLVGVPRHEGSTLTISRVRPHPPAPNSVVLGSVTRLSPLQALLSITVVDGVPLPPGEEFTGVIRSQDVRATEKDKVKIGDCFRGGDVVRGVVGCKATPTKSFLLFSVLSGSGSAAQGIVMTAVLSATDALRKDRHMSLDDNQFDYATSSTDWRAKYNEVADMLAETRAELDDFHHASKELEAELENELQRTEKAQQDLKVKVIRAESERDDWKSKFMAFQTNHNTTTTSLQRELDKLRQEFQQTKIQLRDLEMGNDDLERNERAVSSSLADMEAKYSRALEEKILLEHELLEKASLEEESQRLRDELRDANVEISILKDQLAEHSKSSSSSTVESTSSQTRASLFPPITTPSDDDLLNTPPPPDLQLEELLPSSESLPSANITPKGPSYLGGQSALLQHAGFQPAKSKLATTPTNASRVLRSTTLPTFSSPSTSSPRTPTVRGPSKPSHASTSTISTTTTTSKSKGVQMVSEMRARVRNLEQKIHTRVPRLRMASITGRAHANSPASVEPSSSSSSSRASTAKTSWESLTRRSIDTTRSSSSIPENKKQKDFAGDSSGWVLIMEDSPSPPKSKEREQRRVSSPSGTPTVFRPAASTSIPSPTLGSGKYQSLGQSTINTGIRRPQSRLSAGSLSTTTTSSIPTPTSRPATPTFLPVPSGGLYAHSTTAGMTGLKRSTGPAGPNPYSQTKRSSLGASTAALSPDGSRERARVSRPPSGISTSGLETTKALPQLPGLHSNITMRPPARLPPPSSGIASLAQSRIGRPSSGGPSGRRSTDGTSLGLPEFQSRPRSGSTISSPTS